MNEEIEYSCCINCSLMCGIQVNTLECYPDGSAKCNGCGYTDYVSDLLDSLIENLDTFDAKN